MRTLTAGDNAVEKTRLNSNLGRVETAKFAASNVMQRGLGLLALVFLLAGAGGALAQSNAQAVAGVWEISNADRDRICPVNLKTDPAQGGMKLELDPGCAAAFPIMREVVAWTLSNDTLSLIDARQRTVLQLNEVEHGMYEGERPGEGLYFMQSAAAAGAVPRTAEQMAGEWTLVRGENRAVCALTLLNSPVTGQDGYALRLRQPCDAIVTRFAPAFWRMNLGELVIQGRGETAWRFEEDEPTIWRRVPEGADPWSLVRK